MAVSTRNANDANVSSDKPRYQPLVIASVAVVAGIVADRYCPLPLALGMSLSAGGLSAWLLMAVAVRVSANRLRQGTLRWMQVCAGFLVLMSVAGTAASWHHCRYHLFAANDLGRYAKPKPQPVCVEAVALMAPRAVAAAAPDPFRVVPQGEASRFEVALVGLRDGAAWKSVSGRAMAFVQGTPPKLDAGDRFRCFARLSAPPKPRNPGAFDYAKRLRSEGVLSRLLMDSPECIVEVEPGGSGRLTRWLDRVRAQCHSLLARHVGTSSTALASAMLLGLREGINAAQNEAFMTTGTIHVLSISGLHVGILAGALLWVMRRTPLSQGFALLTVGAVTLLYVMLVDMDPPVVRATVLVLVTCMAMYLGRRTLGFNLLAAAALVVLTLNPSYLFHVGAQLSFLCVAGIIWFFSRRFDAKNTMDSLERLVEKNRGGVRRAVNHWGRWAYELTLCGGAIWLLTLPLVMARFHLISPVGILLNPLLWIPTSVGLISGFCVLWLGAVCPPLAGISGSICGINFWILLAVVDWAHRCPASYFWVPGPSDWWLWGFYGGLGLLAAFPAIRPPRRWCWALLAAWVLLGFANARWPCPRTFLEATFLSVGHGCAVVLELPNGHTMLYDAGQFGASKAGARAISEYLWWRGITHLDAVVLSHPDMDHYNALPEVLKKFSVAAVYASPTMFQGKGYAIGALRNAIESHRVPIREIWVGDRLRAGEGCSIEVLSPPREGIVGTDNANSIVLAVEYCGRRMLLPGDLESAGMERLLHAKPRRCDVLLAPHHGSRKSNSRELAHWSRPRWVVLSGDGRWNVPDLEATYRAGGGGVWGTFDRGAIRVRLDAEGVRMTSFIDAY